MALCKRQVIQNLRISAEYADATNVELLALIHINLKKGEFLFVVERGGGNRSKVDVSEFTVGITQIVKVYRVRTRENSPCGDIPA